MTHAQSMRWLKIACLMTIVTGIACALASHPATDVVWRTLFDLLKWPFDGDPASFNADTRAVNAVLGGHHGRLGRVHVSPGHTTTLRGYPRLASSYAVRLVCMVCGGL